MDLEIFNDCKNLSEAARKIFSSDKYHNREKVKKILHEFGYDWKNFFHEKNTKYCLVCGKELSNSQKQFCSHSCAATYNNVIRGRNDNSDVFLCKNCGKELKNKRNTFCDYKCHKEYEYKKNVEQWKNGEVTGCDVTGDLSPYVRRYMLDKAGHKCEIEGCGFCGVNPYTGLEILQIHHIDGDAFNTKEDNLQVLCPNHHAMTENYGSRNTKCTRIYKNKR